MSENLLIPLCGFVLSSEFPQEVRFTSLVEEHLRKLRVKGRFEVPRFFGYYFQAGVPNAVAGGWTVSLDPVPAIMTLPSRLDKLTYGQFRITSPTRETSPDFMLVQDRLDGACWLWSFEFGRRFVESDEAVLNGPDEVVNHKLLGP
jgi:hypothetical protein